MQLKTLHPPNPYPNTICSQASICFASYQTAEQLTRGNRHEFRRQEVRLWDQPSVTASLLDYVSDLIEECKAGFALSLRRHVRHTQTTLQVMSYLRERIEKFS